MLIKERLTLFLDVKIIPRVNESDINLCMRKCLLSQSLTSRNQELIPVKSF